MLGGIGWPAVLASISLVLLSMLMAWLLGLGLSRGMAVASARAALQLLAVGLIFNLMFESSRAIVWAWLWVGFMIAVSWNVVMNRAAAFGPTIVGLGAGAAAAIISSTVITLVVVFGFGVIDYEPVALVVISGITIGNAMPMTVLGVNQAITLCRDRVGDLEAALSLGFDRRGVVRFLAPQAARSALIPQIERTKVVGVVALPGAMTGLLLGGVEPIDAVVIQLLVMYLVLGSAAICVITVVTVVMRASVSATLQPAEWVRRSDDEATPVARSRLLRLLGR